MSLQVYLYIYHCRLVFLEDIHLILTMCERKYHLYDVHYTQKVNFSFVYRHMMRSGIESWTTRSKS